VQKSSTRSALFWFEKLAFQASMCSPPYATLDEIRTIQASTLLLVLNLDSIPGYSLG
jgi:hypothetical protein